VVDPQGSCTGALAMVSDITERKRAEEAVHQSEEHYRELFHQAYHMQESLRHLSNRILEVQEQERTRISRELHDEVGQALTAISVNLAVLKREVPADNLRFLKKIADSQALLSQSMEAVHGFARELRPALLDDLGLLAAMRSYINAFVERTGIRLQFRAPAAEAVEAMDIAHKAVIYRVAQESLNNIAKHAEAKRVNFTIRRVQQRISIEIQDDGKGFDLEQRPPGKTPDRLGLLGMQERVRLINGEFSIDSQPGRGTLVRVQIPTKPQ
jgi:signal transduction histidine kinase